MDFHWFTAWHLRIITFVVWLTLTLITPIHSAQFHFFSISSSLLCLSLAPSLSISYYYAPPVIGGALSDAFFRRLTSVWRLSVCLSVVYIGPNSSTERPMKTKIGRDSPRHTWFGHHFKVKRSKVKVTWPLWTRPTWTYSNGDLYICVHNVYRV